MAGLAGLDSDRVRQWLFARCVQESVGEPELRPVAARLAP
jgi:streptomycin 6-kinase